MGLLALSANPSIFASEHCEHNHSERDHSEREHCEVKAAQAIYQDETALIPVIDLPIPFAVKDFKTNVGTNFNKSLFEVKVPGLYSLDAYLLLNVPNVGNTVAGYITINERKLLPFFSRETRTLDPVVELHFTDRIVYLKKGDRVSVVLSEFTQGTTVLSRGFVMVALNNSQSSSD